MVAIRETSVALRTISILDHNDSSMAESSKTPHFSAISTLTFAAKDLIACIRKQFRVVQSVND
jgi:hypothetical protein